MLSEGCSYAYISQTLGISTRTVGRYRNGSPELLCQDKHSRNDCGIMKPFRADIVRMIGEGMHQAGIYKELKKKDCPVSRSTVTEYVRSVAKEEGFVLAKNHKRPLSELNRQDIGERLSKTVSRSEIERFLWSGIPMKNIDRAEELFIKYPLLFSLQKAIREFREIFDKSSLPLLYIFIERYTASDIKGIKTFAKGLTKDTSALENAVSSPYSNGFVEGENNRIKMIKRVMFGRCKLPLLRAKIILEL